MGGTQRRNAIRKYGRSHVSGFILGTLSLTLFFFITGVLRNSLIDSFGKDTFLYVFAILSFASFLVPPILWQRGAVRDPWLYCPHCSQFFGTIGAVWKLNREARCVGCSRKIEVAPIDPRQSRFDAAWMLGGLWGLVAMLYLVARVI
ncbi:MAG: hypothetical protein AAFU85_20245 [Planctomycetota bacterium]